MSLTLGELRPMVCDWVANGVPSDSTAVLDFVNEACRLLMDVATTRGITERYTVATDEPYITLPRQYKKAITARVNGAPILVHGIGYTFQEGGPLNDEMTEATYALCDQGDSPTQYDMPFEIVTDADTRVKTKSPIPMHVAAFSRSAADLGAVIFVRGLLETGEEVSELINCSQWLGGVHATIGIYTYSANEYVQILQVVKPVTVGMVSLLTIDPDTDEMANLADYQPAEESTSFRRYLFLGLDLDETTGKSEHPVTVEMICRKAFVPISSDYDLVPVQNYECLRLMAFALRARNAGQEPMAVNYQNSALAILAAENENTSHRGEIVMANMFGLGGIQAM